MENKQIPENANQECPGTQHNDAGNLDSCQGCPNKKICQTKPEPTQEQKQQQKIINHRLDSIKHKILILSGKGGVGKSTLSTQLSFYLAYKNFEIGLLDLDLCGPSIPRTTNLENQEVHKSQEGWSPIYVEDNLGVMSIGFLLPEPDAPVIWRGPKKNGLIQQFLTDVNWGELDFLIIDTPPGTSDEHISIVQYLNMDEKNDGALLISTSQKLSVNDVRKQIGFCKKTNVNIIGVVENMKNLICQNCGDKNPLFYNNNNPIQNMLKDYQLNLIGDVSFSQDLLMLIESGKNLWSEEMLF